MTIGNRLANPCKHRSFKCCYGCTIIHACKSWALGPSAMLGPRRWASAPDVPLASSGTKVCFQYFPLVPCISHSYVLYWFLQKEIEKSFLSVFFWNSLWPGCGVTCWSLTLLLSYSEGRDSTQMWWCAKGTFVRVYDRVGSLERHHWSDLFPWRQEGNQNICTYPLPTCCHVVPYCHLRPLASKMAITTLAQGRYPQQTFCLYKLARVKLYILLK